MAGGPSAVGETHHYLHYRTWPFDTNCCCVTATNVSFGVFFVGGGGMGGGGLAQASNWRIGGISSVST